MVEITRIFWKKAYTADKILLGEIESADLDVNTWQITNLYIGLTDLATKELGFTRPYLGKIHVCLPVSTVQTIEDNAVLNKTMTELRGLKQCKE